MNEFYDGTFNTESTSSTKFCKCCSAEMPSDATVCEYCGVAYEENTPKQEAAQNTTQESSNSYTNNYTANYVNNNGSYRNGVEGVLPAQSNATVVSQSSVSDEEKDKALVSMLLAIFLGEFGVHRFYEGKIATGILWLCTGGLLGVGYIVDLINRIVRFAKAYR